VGRPEQRIYVRMGPDAQTVFVAFSCSFLIKLLYPRYAKYLTQEQRQHIIDTVQRAIDFEGSPEIGIDDRHGPRLYSRFLSRLLEDVKARTTSVETASPPLPYMPRTPEVKLQIPAVTMSLSPPSPAEAPHLFPVAPILPSQVHQAAQRQLQPYPVVRPVARPRMQVQTDYYDPMPEQAYTRFDHFSLSSGASSAVPSPSNVGMHSGVSGMDASTFFASPLPFDSDILHSMQSVSSLSDMHGTLLPGFAWMGQMPPVTTNGYAR